MTVDEALVPRRVDVGLRIRMQVMMAMLGCPPQHAFLGRALRQDGERELERAAGPVGAMREVAVVAGADGENPQPVEEEAEYERLVGHAGPQGSDAREVHEDEGNGRRIHDVGMLDNRSGGLRCNRIAHRVSLKCADSHNRPMCLYSNLERPSLQLRRRGADRNFLVAVRFNAKQMPLIGTPSAPAWLRRCTLYQPVGCT